MDPTTNDNSDAPAPTTTQAKVPPAPSTESQSSTSTKPTKMNPSPPASPASPRPASPLPPKSNPSHSATPSMPAPTNTHTLQPSPHQSSSSSPPTTRGKTSMFAKLKTAVPPWIPKHLATPKSRKIWLRCWIASWAAFILILPNKSLTTLGNAAFFGLLASLMVPPNVPVATFLFIIATMVTGMCTGWAIGCAAMKAALAARNQDVLRASLIAAQEGLAGATNPDAEFQVEIFQGRFLDARSSVVYGVFYGCGCFAFALTRAYLPKFALTSVFGSIVLDIFCAYGPLFPIPEYTLVSSLIISVGCYTAIALVATTLIFPESLCHVYLEGVAGLMGMVGGYLEGQEEVLGVGAEGMAFDDAVVKRMEGMQSGIVGVQQGLVAQGGLIDAEFSYGRWSGSDAKGLEKPLRNLVARVCALQTFPKLVKHAMLTDASSSASASNSTDGLSTAGHNSIASLNDDGPGDTLLVRQLRSSTKVLEEEYGLRPGDLVPIVQECTRGLRTACVRGLEKGRRVVEGVNRRRWRWGDRHFFGGEVKKKGENEKGAGGDEADVDEEAALEEAIEQLRTEIELFKSTSRLPIVDRFLPAVQAFESNPSLNTAHFPLRMLIQSSVYSSILVVSAQAVVGLLEKIQETAGKRRRRRVWAPKGLRAVGKVLLGRGRGVDGGGGAGVGVGAEFGEEERPEVDEVEREEERGYQRDPDSRPPTNTMQRVFDTIHKGYMWLKTAEAQFCIKYVVISVALWLPSVLSSSAYFVYTEKSVWAIIMAQTTLNIYISDAFYNYFARLLGTFIGLIVGLLGWYIGNAKSNGSPYGTAAVMAVFLVPMVFVRIFSPPQNLIAVMMFSATTSLIIGYSWIDGHLFTFGSPGIGWSIAWRRWTLVVIGCAASFIIQMWNPVSGRKAVRYRNAAVITELSSLYSFMMSNWIAKTSGKTSPVDHEHDKDDGEDSTIAPDVSHSWLGKFRERVIGLAAQIQALKMQTAVAKWEGNIRGAWPIEEYMKLVETESDMLAALAQLGGAITHLDPTWRLSLNRRTKILNPNFITDAMSIFALVSQSLRTGEPLHQVLPTCLLDRYLYHNERLTRSRQPIGQDGQRDPEQEKEEKEDREQLGTYTERIQSIDYMYFATGIAAVSQIITGLDELHRIVKRLCGEVPFRGFDEWKMEHDRQYTRPRV